MAGTRTLPLLLRCQFWAQSLFVSFLVSLLFGDNFSCTGDTVRMNLFRSSLIWVPRHLQFSYMRYTNYKFSLVFSRCRSAPTSRHSMMMLLLLLLLAFDGPWGKMGNSFPRSHVAAAAAVLLLLHTHIHSIDTHLSPSRNNSSGHVPS